MISLIHIFIGVLCINIITVLWTYIVSWDDITLRTLPDNYLENITINLLSVNDKKQSVSKCYVLSVFFC